MFEPQSFLRAAERSTDCAIVAWELYFHPKYQGKEII